MCFPAFKATSKFLPSHRDLAPAHSADLFPGALCPSCPTEASWQLPEHACLCLSQAWVLSPQSALLASSSSSIPSSKVDLREKAFLDHSARSKTSSLPTTLLHRRPGVTAGLSTDLSSSLVGLPRRSLRWQEPSCLVLCCLHRD